MHNLALKVQILKFYRSELNFESKFRKNRSKKLWSNSLKAVKQWLKSVEDMSYL